MGVCVCAGQKEYERQCGQIWRNFTSLAKSICPFLEGLFIIWPNFDPTLAKFVYDIGQIFTVASCQILKK